MNNTNTSNETSNENKLMNELETMTVEEFAELVNRLTPSQLELIKATYEKKAVDEKDKVEKAILEKRGISPDSQSIKVIHNMLNNGELSLTVAEIESLPKVAFNQLFNANLLVVQGEKIEKGKVEKLNDFSHKMMISLALYSYEKVANCNEMKSRPVQPFETITRDYIKKYVSKNTFANNTEFPFSIDGISYDSKEKAVEAMTELMFNWYCQSMASFKVEA